MGHNIPQMYGNNTLIHPSAQCSPGGLAWLRLLVLQSICLCLVSGGVQSLGPAFALVLSSKHFLCPVLISPFFVFFPFKTYFVSSISFTFFSILPLPFFCNLSHYRALLFAHLIWALWLRIWSIEMSGCWEDSNEREAILVFSMFFGTAGPVAFHHPLDLTAWVKAVLPPIPSLSMWLGQLLSHHQHWIH